MTFRPRMISHDVCGASVVLRRGCGRLRNRRQGHNRRRLVVHAEHRIEVFIVRLMSECRANDWAILGTTPARDRFVMNVFRKAWKSA